MHFQTEVKHVNSVFLKEVYCNEFAHFRDQNFDWLVR